MTKLFIVSDLHNKQRIVKIEVPIDADAIVLAGDIVHEKTVFSHFAKFGKPVIVVAGNHDFWGHDVMDAVEALRNEASAFDNFHVLDNETLVIDDVRFIGSTFWSSYGNLHPRLVIEAQAYLRDSYKIKAEQFWSSRDNVECAGTLLEAITIQGQRIPTTAGEHVSIDRLVEHGLFHPVVGYLLHQRAVNFVSKELDKDFDGQTIVVTHHPPTLESVRLKYNVKGEVDLEAWNTRRFIPPGFDQFHADWPDAATVAGYGSPCEAMFIRSGRFMSDLSDHHYVGTGELCGADLWIHGHVHDNRDYAFGGTRFVVNAAESPFFDLDNSVFDLNDGLKHALRHSSGNCAYVLGRVIERLEPYAEADELEQLPDGLVYDAVQEKLAAIYQDATEAIHKFEAEFNRALAVDINRCRDPILGVRGDEFDDPLVAGLSPHPFLTRSRDLAEFLGRKNENVLLPAYIKKQVALLKDEMDNLMDITEGRRLLK